MCVDQDDTAAVVSTVLLVTGVNTLLHMLLGTRLPLVQGRPPFVCIPCSCTRDHKLPGVLWAQ